MHSLQNDKKQTWFTQLEKVFLVSVKYKNSIDRLIKLKCYSFAFTLNFRYGTCVRHYFSKQLTCRQIETCIYFVTLQTSSIIPYFDRNFVTTHLPYTLQHHTATFTACNRGRLGLINEERDHCGALQHIMAIPWRQALLTKQSSRQHYFHTTIIRA
jgi:hypothetical protein